MLFVALSRRVQGIWSEVILGAALALVVLNNISASVSFFVEQHRSDFYAKYKRGDGWAPYTDLTKPQVKALADAVNALSEPLSKVPAAVTL